MEITRISIDFLTPKHLSDIIHYEDGNPVKKILLKLNLSDHRSILTDSKEYLKMVMEVPDFSCLTRFIATCSCPTDKYKDIMKAQ
ncbi:hypothetical protein Tco_1271588, partial [Tanacetum coccineum]